ncbi:MAG TPA: type II toxin-antitoxin system HipA family toxin [Solimonas sp.]|nr:type II toxin-antitoxin system HipA family toxin [Solimonas sp.]
MTRAYVWSDLWGAPRLVGAIEVEGNVGEFRYAPAYIAERGPALDPRNLPVGEQALHTRANGGLFGVLSDAGPDAWGRRVLANLHPKRMAKPSALQVLLLASGTGVGALMFSQSKDSVKPRPAPPAPEDLGAAAEGMHAVEQGRPMRQQLQLLLEAGSTLGGVNPKIAVASNKGAWIAKFRAADDIADTPRIEAACLQLARRCGIDALDARHTAIGQRSCIMLPRFDRQASGQVKHYASAHALWNRERLNPGRDYLEWASYMGIADLLREHVSIEPRQDCEELFRRMIFNVVLGNTDDHGKNHGFLMDAEGHWRLAPAFDLVPPVGGQATQQALGIGAEGTLRTWSNALSMATRFLPSQSRAAQAAQDIAQTVARNYAELLDRHGVSVIDRELALGRALLPAGITLRSG